MSQDATMKAIVQDVFGGPEVLHFATVPKPVPGSGDILVQVRAISVNPVDGKLRQGGPANTPVLNAPRILGWDGAGVVAEVGSEVTLFAVGDEVYFAGDITRPGCYAEFVAVDQRIAARKPESLSFEEAAAIPLTALTAWEGLFETLDIQPGDPGTPRTLLMVGGAGGVGSLAIQLARKVGQLNVVATASRPESEAWCRNMGADAIINHTQELAPQLQRLGLAGAEYIFSTATLANFPQLVACLKPLGKICCIQGGPDATNVDVSGLMPIRGTLAFELMFTRPRLDVNPERQGQILNRVAVLLDQKTLVGTMSRSYSWHEVQAVHAAIDTTHTLGKMVMRLD